MRRLMLGLAMATLAMARPELYREKEDFQYSRSSSDEGTKSGFYDAQRGNMGGNYEKAHNMDALAQHQMGGLVRQVEGELGDGSQTRTGSVFSAANSRGVYGSGHYDLSNLAGRNFQEGLSYADSHQASSANSAHTLHSSSSNNERYRNSGAHSSGYHQSSLSNNDYTAQLSSNNNEGYKTNSGHSLNSDYRGYQSHNQQEEQNLYDAKQYEHGMQAGHNSVYHSQSRFNSENLNSQRVNTDHIAAQNMDANTHHRLISTVPVKIIVRPGQRIAVPIATQTHSGSQISSFYDENAINKDTEVVSTDINQQHLKPINTGKHYESAYSYHKEWEKHDTRPAVIPLSLSTVAPIPKNSELYDDSYTQHGTQYNSNKYENANYNSASSKSRYQTDFNARHHGSDASNTNLNDYSQNAQSANLIGIESAKPKSYQSAYSYHKSWERQGDPYTIKPAYNGVYEAETSGKLTDASASQAAYSSYNYGSRQMQNQHRYSSSNCMIECEPSHSRVARSSVSNGNQFEEQNQNKEDLGQQTQNQWDNLAELGQQTQDQWVQIDNFGQQAQSKEQLEEFGQQTQDSWSQRENEGQQTQSKWEQSEKLGQQTQNTFDNLEDLGQQVQTKWDTDSANQYSQSQSNLNEHVEQQSQKFNTEQEPENKWEQLEDHGQQTQTKWDSEDVGQQTQDFGQAQKNNGQEMQDIWEKLDINDGLKSLEILGQQSENKWNDINTQENGQSRVSKPDDLERAQKSNTSEENLSVQHSIQSHGMTVQTSSLWQMHKQENVSLGNNKESDLYSSSSQSKLKPHNKEPLSSLWGLLSNLDDEHIKYNKYNRVENFSQSSKSQQYHNNLHQRETFDDAVSNTDSNSKNFSNTNFETFAKHENGTGKLSENKNVIHKIELQDIKTTTQKTDTVKKDLPKYFEGLEKQITTTTENERQSKKFRVTDIGRGDIPEDLMIGELTAEKSYSETSDSPYADRFTIINNTNEPSGQKEVEALTNHNNDMRQQSAANGLEKSQKRIVLTESEVMEATSPKYHQENTQQHFEAFDQNKFSKINKQNIKEVEEIAPELKQNEGHIATIRQRNIEKEIETFNHTKGLVQENQHFIDFMQNFENQNSYQSNNEQLQIPKFDQQANLQNTEQQFYDDFSQQSQAPEQSFDQEFVDFNHQNDKSIYQKQQSYRNPDPVEFIPEPVNLDELQLSNKKSGQYNKNLSDSHSSKPTYPKDLDYHVLEIEEIQKQDKSQNVVTDFPSTQTSTERPGFWNSVGDKLSNVKNKVSSWFSS